MGDLIRQKRLKRKSHISRFLWDEVTENHSNILYYAYVL